MWWKREGSGERKERDSGGANSVCKAGHGGTRVSRRVSTQSGRFEEPLGSGMVTPVPATGTPRGAWSRDQRGQKRPSRWCSGRYRLVEVGGGKQAQDRWRQREGPSAFPTDPRVRPMSAAELRRGEQSALHCSGTRTLQVRNPLPPPTPTPPPPNLPGGPSVPFPGQLCPRPQPPPQPPQPRPQAPLPACPAPSAAPSPR